MKIGSAVLRTGGWSSFSAWVWACALTQSEQACVCSWVL